MIPKFTANYPYAATRSLLNVPERIHAREDYTGEGVVIAYLDAGFYMHRDLRDRILLHVDATTSRIREEREVSHVDVTSWHGLMVSAIGSGNGMISQGYYRSAAPQSQMVLIKVSNPRMEVKEPDIMRGFRWLLKAHRHFNIKVVNVSVGGDAFSDKPDHPLHDAVRKLVAAGVTVVIAAGNHGRDWLVPPASSPDAIVVGGYNDHNSLDVEHWTGYHSNWGQAYDGSSKPDVIAPAQWIASPILPDTLVAHQARWVGDLIGSQPDTAEAVLADLLQRGYKDLNIAEAAIQKPDDTLYRSLQDRINQHKLINKYYQYVDGTSVAAPIVSSVVAQMLQANPRLLPDQIKAILKSTARPIASIPAQQQGAGAIQASDALQLALQL